MIAGPKTWVSLKKMKRTPDGMGGYNNEYVEIAKFKAVLAPNRGKENLEQYEKEVIVADYILYANWIPNIDFDEFHIIEVPINVQSKRKFKIVFNPNPFLNKKFIVLYLVEVK